MAAQVQKLRRVETEGNLPPRSPERQQLAEAIERHATALKSIQRVNEAHEHAAETVYRTTSALEAAEAAIIEARHDGDDHLAAIALGDVAAGQSPLAAAEAEVIRNRAELDVARRTRDALAQRAERDASEVERAKAALDDAIADVMRAEVPVADMLDRAQEMQRNLIAARVVLRRLHRLGVANEAASFLRDIDLPAGAGQVDYGNFDDHPAEAAWRAATEPLKSDADAALPMG